MRRLVLVLAFALAAQPAHAQGLRDLIAELFIFGEGQDPLFLAGTAGETNPASVQAHSSHFVPSAANNGGTLISFLENSIAVNVANIPLSSTSSGFTYRLQGGTLVRTTTSPGPIFGERGQTLGKGRVLVAANMSTFSFSTLRGVDLEELRLNFTHVNADFPGCDTIFGGDCTLVGIPGLENDHIALQLALDIDITAYAFFLNYGLLDRVDIGVAIPIVSTRLRGVSHAQVEPFGGTTATHFFAGTPSDPTLTATRTVEGSASGIGDIATRIKIGLSETERTRFAILADARLATGNASDFLGAGDFALRGLGILSATFGGFSPHANVGYAYRNDSLQTDAVLATLGFDHVLAPWATLAVDFVSEMQVGDSKLVLPADQHVDVPFERIIEATTIPNLRDDILNGSFGFKFVTQSGVTIVTNALIPLNDGGLRSRVLWTGGLEFNF